MTGVAISNAFVHTIRLWGPWIPIHILTLVLLPVAVWRAHVHDILRHRNATVQGFSP